MTSLADQLACAKRYRDFVVRKGAEWTKKKAMSQDRVDADIIAFDALITHLERDVLLQEVSDELKGEATRQVPIIYRDSQPEPQAEQQLI